MNYKAEIKNIKTDSFSMDYIVFGEGKKNFVMLPGISIKKVSESAQAVANSYSQFCEEYTVYVFERKDNIEAGYSIEKMADDTAEAMRILGIENAYVFGVSQGGMIAQCLAINHPELVKKLVLASTSAYAPKETEKLFFDWITYSLKGETRKLVACFLDNIYTEKFLKQYRDFLLNLYEKTPSDELIRFSILSSACIGFDVSEKLSSVNCPALVIGAENDLIFNSEKAYFLAEALKANVYIYKDFGHAVYDEAPDFKDKIEEFFKD
ncbi:MAG: alpha/beta hydrolase [Clostridia bacterium]|nr:alpha/beta hydrolase [Clostridia bacterium]